MTAEQLETATKPIFAEKVSVVSVQERSREDTLMKIQAIWSELAFNIGGSEYLRYNLKHQAGVAVIADIEATVANISEIDKDIATSGSLVHDIGKPKLPPHLQQNDKKYTDEEKEEVKQHVNLGFWSAFEKGVRNQTVLEIILSHHERPNGSGYPDGKKADIPLEASIVMLADTVHASAFPGRPHNGDVKPPLALLNDPDLMVGEDYPHELQKAFEQTLKIVDSTRNFIIENVDALVNGWEENPYNQESIVLDQIKAISKEAINMHEAQTSNENR